MSDTVGFYVFMAIFIAAICAPSIVGEYQKGKCRVEAIKALQDPKMINEICGR